MPGPGASDGGGKAQSGPSSPPSRRPPSTVVSSPTRPTLHSNDSADSSDPSASLSMTPKQSYMHSTAGLNVETSRPGPQHSTPAVPLSPSAGGSQAYQMTWSNRNSRSMPGVQPPTPGSREHTSSVSNEDAYAVTSGGQLGRGYPTARPTSSTNRRGTSSTTAVGDRDASMSSGLPQRAGTSLSAYATSDFDSQSMSGLSASELESGDELGQPPYLSDTARTKSYTIAPQSAAQSRSSSSHAGPTAPLPSGQQGKQLRRPSASRSQSRQRRSSAATPRQEANDFFDDDNDAYGPMDEEDDEVVPQDRGEELVRRRMRARQKEKRRKEKEAEKKRSNQQQKNQQTSSMTGPDPASPRPSSPQPRRGSSLLARATSPTHGDRPPAVMNREGRPTYIPLPRTKADGQQILSPGGQGPATSPGPTSFRQALASGVASGSYPSPHSHIRRQTAQPASSEQRMSGAIVTTPGLAPRSGSHMIPSTPRKPVGQQTDVFSESAGGNTSSNTRHGGITSRDHDDEDRDKVADLRGRRVTSQHPNESSTDAYQSIGSQDGDEAPTGGTTRRDEHDDGDGNGVEDADEPLDSAQDDDDQDEPSNEDSSDLDPEDVEYTLKDRQDAINIEHPFGLPIWKPALYKKSRTVTRNAEIALHSIPSRAAEQHLLPGNILWTLIFGVWLSIICVVASLVLRIVPYGGPRYARVAWELGGYLFWPFGKYVEVEISPYTGERTASARIDGNNRWSFVDEDGGIGEDGLEDEPNDRQRGSTYTDAFTPVAARFPHDHEHHRIAFNSRPSRPQSRTDLSMGNYDTIRPGDVAYDAVGQESAPLSGGEAGTSTVTPRAVSDHTILDGDTEDTPLKGGSHQKSRQRTSYGALDDAESEASSNTSQDASRVAREQRLYEYVVDDGGRDIGRKGRWLGATVWGIVFWLVITPVLGIICLACWAGVVTIPMAKLSWVLLKNLARHPLALHFGSAFEDQHQKQQAAHGNGSGATSLDSAAKRILMPLKPGQAKINGLTAAAAMGNGTGDSLHSKLAQHHPLDVRRSKILLCTYRAIGGQYYKYTVGGVNILFVNTLPFVGFTILDFFFLEPYVQRHGIQGGFLAWVSSQSVIFIFALGSVIPLSYFIGMAVASISAQSSIGMGAVINATFGSIIEIVLYGIALTQEKARLVEGSIIGSILAGVLLMPGLSMCSGATRRKEQRFNARSAGVTSTMLIMAIIGILTPTLFYQIYGTFQLTCTGCPATGRPGQDWTCKRCFYEHVPPATDTFYQGSVKGLMYTCTVILVLSYAIGLWFSLRTHASQIWQNPQGPPAATVHPHGQHPNAALPPLPAARAAEQVSTAPHSIQIPSAQRASIYKKLLPASVMQQLLPLTSAAGPGRSRASSSLEPANQALPSQGAARTDLNRTSESGSRDPPPLRLPDSFTQEEYASAMAFTASAFQTAIRQHQQEQAAAIAGQQQQQQQPLPSTAGQQQDQHHQRPVGVPSRPGSRVSIMPQATQHSRGAATNQGAGVASLPAPASGQHTRGVSMVETEDAHGGGHGGHDAPSWSRAVSLTVLLSCTVLYAIIAEILVDVVDVVLDGSGIDEKFLGITLFALVPNTTEFMNAMSFAINGNIALSMEIGSAYALQVCLIQIPAMVAFSAYYNAGHPFQGGPGGHLIHRSFTLIFPRWDVIAIIFSVFLLTYTYIEARSNYYRGSICILSYLVLVAGFFFAPSTGDTEAPGDGAPEGLLGSSVLMAFETVQGRLGASPLGQTVMALGTGGATSTFAHGLPRWGWSAWTEALWGALFSR